MEELLHKLSQATNGLLVQSETDAPLSLFVWPEPLPFTPAALLAARSLPADTAVEVCDLARFFGSRTRIRPEQTDDERATALRFQELQTLLETHLTNIQVVRVGTIEITVWIAGQTCDKRIVG
ncbi:MAG TPA: nuclease A inhibitor family protein, partial [Roseiflexaceae bacterium]|nr:nuclease A inhibitor family protein [Roseiflexaceae bacterium]